MNEYYLMDEDSDSPAKVYLGEIILDREEREAMLLRDTHRIPEDPLIIPVDYRNPEMSDFLNLKFPLISDKLKNILDEHVTSRIYYRPVFLEYQDSYEAYYYFIPHCYEGIDFAHSDCQKDEGPPGRIKFGERGFYLRPNVTGMIDIFRLNGLSPWKILITGALKKIFTDNGIIGVKYTPTYRYQDGDKRLKAGNLRVTATNNPKAADMSDKDELIRQNAQRIREVQAQARREKTKK
jgi:hypothetical protein